MKKRYFLVFVCLVFLGMPNVYAEVDCSLYTDNADLVKWVSDIYTILKYLALVLTVGLGMLDFFKAITASDDKAIKKSAQTFVKRIIAVVVLFLIPILLEFFFGIIGLAYCS